MHKVTKPLTTPRLPPGLSYELVIFDTIGEAIDNLGDEVVLKLINQSHKYNTVVKAYNNVRIK